MNYKSGRIVAVLLLLQGVVYADESTGSIVEKIATRVRQNVEAAQGYGYYKDVVLTKRNSSGKINKQERKTFRTIWIMDQPYNELLQVEGRDLTKKEEIAESKRRSDFIKVIYKDKKESGIQQELKSIRWWDVYKRYDFTLLPSESDAKYVLSFQPKKGKLPERNRFDRLLNRFAGKVWVDEDFNVRKAEARLTNPVRFGLILAKVDEVQVRFTQRRHGDAWLPASLHLVYAANVALFKHDRNELTVTWNDPYPRSGNIRVTTLTK